jgi:hypothetical protein
MRDCVRVPEFPSITPREARLFFDAQIGRSLYAAGGVLVRWKAPARASDRSGSREKTDGLLQLRQVRASL